MASSTDLIAEGSDPLRQYFRNERVIRALSTGTTDDLPEGVQHKFFTEKGVRDVLSVSSTSDLQEGAKLYFTSSRVRQELSLATSDAVPEGLANRYLTRTAVLSLNLDVAELSDGANLLLTNDSFLQKATTLLTTDLIGNRQLSEPKPCAVMQDLSTTISQRRKQPLLHR